MRCWTVASKSRWNPPAGRAVGMAWNGGRLWLWPSQTYAKTLPWIDEMDWFKGHFTGNLDIYWKKNCSCCVFPLKPAQYWSKVFPIRFCHGFSTIEACSRTLPGWLTWTLGILLSAFCHHLNMLHVGFLAKKTPTAGSWAAMTNTIWLVRSICSIKCDRFLLKLWVFSFNVWTPCNSYESTPSHNCGNDRPWTCS